MPLCFKRGHCLSCRGVRPLPGWVMCSARLSVTRRAAKGGVWHWSHRAFCWCFLGFYSLPLLRKDKGAEAVGFWTIKLKKKTCRYKEGEGLLIIIITLVELNPGTEEQTVRLQSTDRIDFNGKRWRKQDWLLSIKQSAIQSVQHLDAA